ncbi:MAG: endonuclease [Bacteroidota bacterium]
MNITTRLLLFLLLSSTTAHAQGFQSVFPNLSGQELIDNVASYYRPTVVLDYARARDTLYGAILSADDDSIRCIYSGHTLYLAPNQDPTQYIYLNGTTSGMNTEHAYPQAKGAADGNARSDMHHLYPARIPVNEARGDKPFADIPDNQTDKWFLNNTMMTTIPTTNIGGYAESNETNFEPREASKGDIARSVFYFYTMYRAQANAADPDYFELQRHTLCQWNEQDPATNAELVKTYRIAHYQSNKPNPFVIDCTLAHRCWCPEVPLACTTDTHAPAQSLLPLRVSPNPAQGPVKVETTLPFAGTVRIRLYSLLGQELNTWEFPSNPAGDFKATLEVLTPQNAIQTAFLEFELISALGHKTGTATLVFAKN